MTSEFKTPNFEKKSLELRYENEEICIYGTTEGITRLRDFCDSLINNPEQGHIHINDYNITTDESKKGVIAIF